MLVGVVGQIASGKGVLVDYLVKKLGFSSFSLSSIIHDELKKKGVVNFDRTLLQNIGDNLRKKYGSDILVKRALKKIKQTRKKHYVIEGIRNPAEVEYLKKQDNFFLIGIKAKRTLRFNRLLKRKKPWDPKKWSDFIKVDRRDLGIGQTDQGQQVSKCLAYCDYVLTNNGKRSEFEKKIERLIKRIINL